MPARRIRCGASCVAVHPAQFAIGGGESQKKSTPICVYVEYFGNPREYEVWIDVVLLGYDEMMEGVEEAAVTYGPFDLNLPANAFVEGRYYYL